MEKEDDIIQLLKIYNQEHIISLMEKLEESKKQDLVNQIFGSISPEQKQNLLNQCKQYRYA